ncbi:MAG: 4Fe-4S binding protein [Lachnospiraceae bacterium]|nr:4Fe-4S binding protein [Lachnospiraceae bacterium]
MGTEQKTHFTVDRSKCIQCGKCINVCSGMVIKYGQDGYPEIKEFERYGWRGCWRCEHCLAVCPVGAISIFDKKPENSLLPPPPEMGTYMEQLVVNRRSCRRYLDKNVDPEIISRILNAMASAPTGGNSCGVEYTVIDDKDRVNQIWKVAYSDMEDSKINCNIATTYFELLANAFGLGTIIMSYASDVLQELSPKAREMLGIPSDHYMKLVVGFGYPEIKYARGVQKDRGRKVHRYTQEKK